jgi:hypothetical protein
MSAIAEAIAEGSAAASSQASFLRAVDEHPETILLRADGVEHLRAVAWVVASVASWATLTARPTWPVLMERTGLSRASVARWLAWLRVRGLLGIVESGTTPRFAPMALARDAGNRAAVYVLCVPSGDVDDVQEAVAEDELAVSVDKSETPTFLVFDLKKNPYAGAREISAVGGRDASAVGEKRSDGGAASWGRAAVAGSRADRLALVERLQGEAPALRPCSAPAVHSELRPWLARAELGWTVDQLLHALDHAPDGQPYTYTAAVRVPLRWLRHRMSAWLDEHGQPLPSPSVQRAAAQLARCAATEQERAERDAQRQRLEDERAYGQLVRSAVGEHYPALVAAVLAAQPVGVRLMPSAAAEALTRSAVRAIAGTDTSPAVLAAAAAQLLDPHVVQ